MKWWDLVSLTAIFFGPALVTSISMSRQSPDAVAPTVPEFTSASNWGALLQQALLLAVGVAYLCGRRIRLARWSVRSSWRGAALGVGLFAFTGLVFDLAYSVYGALAGGFDQDAGQAEQAAPRDDVSLAAYSAFNAFYEEFFFLVVCLSVPRRYRARAVAYSLAVRFAVHTYQGLFNAAMIGVVSGGVIYAVTRCFGRDEQWIFPAVVSHALADFFGAGLLSLFYPAGEGASR